MTGEEEQCLMFEICGSYALEVGRVLEIVELPEVTSVPQAPAYIAGIVNLRGQAVPLIDMRVRFGCSTQTGPDKRRSVVVADFEGARLGLLVDRVLGLTVLSVQALSQAPTPPLIPPSILAPSAPTSDAFIRAVGVYCGVNGGVGCDEICPIIDLSRVAGRTQ